MLKVKWVFAVVSMKARAIAALGKEPYLRLVGETKRISAEEGSQRVINGQQVGKKLTPSSGTPEVSPDVCPHPLEKMKARSNMQTKSDGTQKGKVWWTCLQCLSRWERIPLPTAKPKPARKERKLLGTNLMGFGRHKEKTYLDVWCNHQGYCTWAMTTDETQTDASPQLRRFATWLRQGDDPMEESEIHEEEDPTQVHIGTDSEEMSDTEDWARVETPTDPDL